MVITTWVGIWLGYANIFIAVFIMVYAYLFLQQTNEHRDRRPWDFLFVASVLYLVFQILNVLFLSGFDTFQNISVDTIRDLFAFLYSGSVLLAFISQHDLILRGQLILISKKDEPQKTAEKDVEVKIGLGKNEPEMKTSVVKPFEARKAEAKTKKA